MRDTFLTINYKGFYIHTCQDRERRREIVTVLSTEFKSLHAAKIHVTTKLIPEHNKAMCEFARKERLP